MGLAIGVEIIELPRAELHILLRDGKTHTVDVVSVEVVHGVLHLGSRLEVLLLASLDIEAAGEPEDPRRVNLSNAEHVWVWLRVPNRAHS